MIEIGRITIEELSEKKVRLVAPIRIDKGTLQTIWFEVKQEYKNYLCSERSDAFIVGVLNYAMRNGHDIVFETPISSDLFYNLNVELIDVLCKTGESYYRTTLLGPISQSKLSRGKAVGTGISCGVDSFFSIANHINDDIESYKITHLTFNNVGSHGEGEKATELYNQRVQRSRNFAKEYNIPLIESNSNIYDVIKQNHYMTHTYTSCFAILCLQKLYSKYYYSSSIELKDLSFKDSDKISPGHYEKVLLSSFSVNGVEIYSEGANASRFEKTYLVSSYSPSYKYLNVCIPENENCGKCEKCMRTLLGLEAVGALEKYRLVFNIDEYLSHKNYNYAFLFKYTLKKKEDYLSIYSRLKSRINTIHKIYAVYLLCLDLVFSVGAKLVSFLPENARNKIAKLYHKYL